MFQPLSGFRDTVGPTKGWVSNELRQIFEQYGYQALDTPAIERQEVLLGKLGDEGQKQLYLFEDNGKRKVGLRYDLTVSLARYVAANLGTLALPFKSYEIGYRWRAEKPQKGRYRQFTQADIDIIGAPEPASELELLSVAATVGERLGIAATLQLNDRRLVTALLDQLKIPADIRPKLLQLLDKQEKLASEEFSEQFRRLGLTEVEQRQLRGYFLSSDDDGLEKFEQLLGVSESLSTIKTMLSWAKGQGLKAEFSPAMVRGLDYYTGTIFELKADDYASSIAGGGRYDSLIKELTGEEVTAVGLSFGVDRLTEILEDRPVDRPMFIARLPETTNELSTWVSELRKRGLKVEVYLDDAVDLGRQIKYAVRRGYQSIIIPLEEAWKSGSVEVKDLRTGKQEQVLRSQFAND